jgi:hypothetical protein
MNRTKQKMMYCAIARSDSSTMASHFIEAMETAQRPRLKFVSAWCRFRCLILAASHVPGLGETRTILNACNCTQPCMTQICPPGASGPTSESLDTPCHSSASVQNCADCLAAHSISYADLPVGGFWVLICVSEDLVVALTYLLR